MMNSCQGHSGTDTLETTSQAALLPLGKEQALHFLQQGPRGTLPSSPSVSPARVGLRKGLMSVKVGW